MKNAKRSKEGRCQGSDAVFWVDVFLEENVSPSKHNDR